MKILRAVEAEPGMTLTAETCVLDLSGSKVLRLRICLSFYGLVSYSSLPHPVLPSQTSRSVVVLLEGHMRV